VSTQAGICSPETALAHVALGAKRLVLARELNLEEIRLIRAALPDEIELEAFIHGSMCVSYSGRCMLSNQLVGRDANRGACAQPCRWNYTIVEEKRPNEPLPMLENENGTFIMSSKDMCMLRHVEELIKAGVTSFKIEGRMKSAYYTAVITNAYRMAIDAYLNDPDGYTFNEALYREVESVSHREYCTGYWFDDKHENPQLCRDPGYIREKAYFAAATEQKSLPEELIKTNESGTLYRFRQRNKLCVGDAAELLTPGRVGIPCRITELYNEQGEPIESAPHPLMIFYARLPFAVAEGDILRAGDAD
jgi:putative protease